MHETVATFIVVLVGAVAFCWGYRKHHASAQPGVRGCLGECYDDWVSEEAGGGTQRQIEHFAVDAKAAVPPVTPPR